MGWNSKRGGHKGLAADQFARLARWVIRYRLVVLPGAVLLGAISIFGIQRVVVQDSWIDGFAEESEFRRATDAFNEQFHGGHTLLVAVDAGRERFAGRITGADFDGLWIKLPLDSVAPESVMDWRLRLTRTDPPIKPEGSPTRREAVLNSWTTWITEALREGAFLRVKGIPTHGMAKLSLRLSDSDGAWFELVPARLSRPETMGAISALETFLESQWALAVGGVVGTADYVETVNFLRRGRKVGTRSIPLMAEEVEWVWREYAQMRGEKRIRQLINADSSRSVITVFLNNANFVDTAELMRRIRAYEKEHLAPTGVSLAFAGDVAVSQALIGAIVGTQVISVAAALAGDLVVTVLLGRSLAFGALCVIPSLLAVLLNFAVMGWWGIPLGVATSMFSSMTLGMGVDYAIHFLQCYRQQRTQGTNFGADPAGIGESVTGRPLGTADPPAVTEENAPNHDAVVAAARITGPAIFGNTLAVTLGFGVLMLSQVPANARLGALLVLSLFNCFGATMLILPAIVAGNPSRKSENREPAKVLCG